MSKISIADDELPKFKPLTLQVVIEEEDYEQLREMYFFAKNHQQNPVSSDNFMNGTYENVDEILNSMVKILFGDWRC